MLPVIKIAVLQAEGKDISSDEFWLDIEPRAVFTYFNEGLSDLVTFTETVKGFDVIYVMADANTVPTAALYRLPEIQFIVDERKSGVAGDLSEWLDERAAEMAEAVTKPEEYSVFLDTIRQGYNEDYSTEYLKKVGRYILDQAEVNGPEYRLLCWIFYRGILTNPGVNVPEMPKTLPNGFTLADLPEAFAKSEKRIMLLEKLKSFIAKFKQIYQVDQPIKVVVGGSFADPAKPFPGDIDCIVLVPKTIWDAAPYRFVASYASSIPLEEDLIDYKLLPEYFELKSFKAYSDLSLMANNTRFRDVKMAHNFFEPRDLLVLLI